MKATSNTTEWLKIGIKTEPCFIVKDVIAYISGCFIYFINIITGEQTFHAVNIHSVNGNGVKAIAGHRSINVFAYAENCPNAFLYVKNFPAFDTIVKFTNGPPEGYSAMTFSEMSLLITLGDLPNFSLTVWNWRTKEKRAEVDRTNLLIEQQILRCSWSKPCFVIQMGIGTNKIFLWDVLTCCKKIVLAKHVIKVPKSDKVVPFRSMIWTTEGAALIVDASGNVFMIDNEFSLQNIIEVDIEGTKNTDIEWYKTGIVVAGPNTEIRHYKKAGTWSCDWTIQLEIGIKNMINNRTDYLIVVNDYDEIVKLSNTEDASCFADHDSDFQDICLINPLGKYIVALRHSTWLNLYHIVDGKHISSIQLKSTALSIAENPELPYVAVGYDSGSVDLISFYNPETPNYLASFNLFSKPIQLLKFFEQGRVMVAAYLDSGKFFIIQGLPGSHMKVVAHVDCNHQIVDYMLVASSTCFRLFVIPVTTNFLAGNKIIRYCIIDKDNISTKEYSLESNDIFYHRLVPMSTINRDRTFYALPFSARTIHVLETRRGNSLAKLTHQIRSGHQLCKFELNINKRHAITWGYDGFIMVRSYDFVENVGMAVPHHLFLGGVKKACVDTFGQYIVSLGRESIFLCTKIVENRKDEELEKELENLLQTTKYALMFKRPTIGFVPEGRFEDKTWLEVEEIRRIEREEIECRAEKEAIMNEFDEIRNELVSLVTRDIQGPENEHINLTEFYLDTATYAHNNQKNKMDCKNMETYLKALIVAQDKVSNHIMKTYYEPMGVKGQIIRGIWISTMATIYTLLPPNPEKEKKLAWVEEQRKVEQFLTNNDTFEPWMIIPAEKLLRQIRQPVKLATQDYTRVNTRNVLDESSFSQLSLDSQIAINGSVSQLHIEVSPGHYKQRQLVSFYQCDLQQTIAEFEVIKLKQKYNIAFQELVERKYREMEKIKEKNARLRHIISEYNYFSEGKIRMDIVDPKWTQEEKPWLIAQVSDDELTITPYISPSEQAILDAKAAEEERIRLALLADDFRERALMTMMNGVLEIKWEDELKKDVPLPKCMVEKDPTQFTEDDLRAVKDYEEKVAFLNSERERYKNILDVEFTKTACSLRDSINKFNQRVKDAVEYKMCIDSGMNQENLRVNRNRQRQNERIKLSKREREITKLIKENEEIIEGLQKTLHELSQDINECRTNLEVLPSKEKLLEKAFKREFQDASPIIQEQAIKLYKRRPRTNFKQITSTAVVLELAKCLLTHEKSLLLTHDCLEYMKALDQLDQFVGLPPTIDETIYNVICKHRRLRIEFEVKLRAHQMEVADGEVTIATFQKRIMLKKEKNIKLAAEMQQIRADYLYLMLNQSLQFVLRRGIVEIPLSGAITDFDDAIFVPNKEIEEINTKIREAGEKKLQTIMRNMAFRRKIMAMEWEHQKLRMEINDIIEQINDIEGIKFTREMQLYLKGKHLGRKTDVDSFEQEVEVIAMAFENSIRDRKEKIAKITKQIAAYKEQNESLDKAMQDVNIDVCYLKIQQDMELQVHENEIVKARMDALLRRGSIVKQIQQNHNEILVLQTELELLRLKTYPTFKYKLINTDETT